MLYISTRNKVDSYTAHRALHQEFAGDGGMYVPFRLTAFDPQQLQEWKGQSAGEAIAQILNGFFGLSLSGWDVECAVGRTPLRTVSMNRRMTLAECWRNLGGSWEFIVKNLYACMGCAAMASDGIRGWARVAIEIALLFGIYTQMETGETDTFDICVAGGDFSTVVASLYAKDMGLPVGKILCVCNENSNFWDLVRRGEYNTGAAAIRTTLPSLDVVRPQYLEHLIYRAFGLDGVRQYLESCESNGIFSLGEESKLVLENELAVTVSSTNRVDAVISSIYRTNGYIADPVTALTYGGLQDYRASTGISNHTLLLAKESPVTSAGRITRILGITENEMIKQINSPKE